MTGVAPAARLTAQESGQAPEAIISEATSVAAMTPVGVTQGSSLSFDEQMINELLGRQSDPFADLPFGLGGFSSTSDTSTQTITTHSEARAQREAAMLAEINAEMAAAVHGGDVDGGAAGRCPTPLMIVSPGGTLIDTNVPVPPPAAESVPPTPPVGSIPIESSSDEDVDIMPSPEGSLPKEKGSKRKGTGGSSSSSRKKKLRKQKD